MSQNDFWIVLTACLVSLCCSIPGCFLVLRKMSMIGDAISHAILPGIVIAYIISGSRSDILLLIGASLMGLIVTAIIELLQKKIKIQHDAAIGLTYTFLFAIGIILISLFAGQIDLDQECVLYGEIAYVPFDLIFSIPRQVIICSCLFILLLVLFLSGFKELYISSFDPEYAISIGMNVLFWHYLLMGMVSVTTVISFESVGAILVISLLIGPAATASLFAKRLPQMIIMAGFLGISSSIIGYLLASFMNASISGAIATVNGVFFIFAVIVKKRRLGLKTILPDKKTSNTF